jgi:hypothetical protein
MRISMRSPVAHAGGQSERLDSMGAFKHPAIYASRRKE